MGASYSKNWIFAGLALAALVLSSQAQTAGPFGWTPPAPRLKASTPFSPKPISGGNIFAGEAEVWLANAGEKLEGASLTAIKDDDVSRYVSAVGNNLVLYSREPKRKFVFVVLNRDYEDAFDMCDGRIYITLGLLKSVEHEDELAGIIAHEMAHDAFHHIPRMFTRQLFWMTGKQKVTSQKDVDQALDDLMAAYDKDRFSAFGEQLLGFARFDELEADRAAFYNIYKAGYNPSAMKRVFSNDDKKFKEETGDNYDIAQAYEFFFGNHPPSSQRALAMSWESNWVTMPVKHSRYASPAFDAMKAAVAKL